MNERLVERMLAHMRWADHQVLAALRVHASESALKCYAHVLAAERVWYLRVRGEDWTKQRVWPSLSLDECELLAETTANQYHSYLASLDAAELEREVTYTNSQGQTFTNSVADILTHVALHGVHHRGQIAAALRAEDITPPVLDYIRFVREF